MKHEKGWRKWLPNIPGESTYTIVKRNSGDTYQLIKPTTILITVPKDAEEAAILIFHGYLDQTVTTEKEGLKQAEISNVIALTTLR